MSSETSLSDDFTIRCVGYGHEVSQDIINALIPAVGEFGRHFPLKHLEGITVASDYAEGLKSVQDTLVSNPTRLTPTDFVEGQSVAMAIPLNRSGKLKTHVVFGPMLISAMSQKDPERSRVLTESLLFHELAHATEYEIRYSCLGDAMLSSSLTCFTPLEYYLWNLCSHAWDEYFACKIEKLLTREPSSKDELFFSSLKRLRENSRRYKTRYHLGLIQGPELHTLVGSDIKLFITSLAYVLGDNDGLDTHGVAKSEAFPLIHQEEFQFLKEFHNVLLNLWSTMGKWDSIRDILALNTPAISLFNKLGLTPFQGEDDDKDVYLEINLSTNW